MKQVSYAVVCHLPNGQERMTCYGSLYTFDEAKRIKDELTAKVEIAKLSYHVAIVEWDDET